MDHSVTKKRAQSNEIDMLNGPLFKKILLFALPLAASSLLQELFNSVDVAVVGHFVGSRALAAVGSNAPVIGLLINLYGCFHGSLCHYLEPHRAAGRQEHTQCHQYGAVGGASQRILFAGIGAGSCPADSDMDGYSAGCIG